MYLEHNYRKNKKYDIGDRYLKTTMKNCFRETIAVFKLIMKTNIFLAILLLPNTRNY